MRRIFIGLITVLTLAGAVVLSSPAKAVPDLPHVPGVPCGGPLPCGGIDEKVEHTIDKVERLCPRDVCP